MRTVAAIMILLFPLGACAAHQRKSAGNPGKDGTQGAEASRKASNETPAQIEDKVFRLTEEGKISEAQGVAKRSGLGGDDLTRLQGILYYSVGQADQALNYLKRAHEVAPEDARIALLLAEVLCWKKDLRSAKAIAGNVPDATIKAAQRPWELMMHKAAVLGWTKELGPAEEQYTEVQRMPGVPDRVRTLASVRVAEIASWHKDFTKCSKIIDGVLATQPGHVEASLVKGQVLEWQGRYKEAKSTYAAALQAHPSDNQLRYRLEKLSWVK